jgi:hypothetical protein
MPAQGDNGAYHQINKGDKMSFNDAIAIEDYYADKWDDARRKGKIGHMERKLHNKELRSKQR